MAKTWLFISSMITPQGKWAIKNCRSSKIHLLTYHLTKHDKNNLAQGLGKLSQLLISAGAKVYSQALKEDLLFQT